MQQNEWRMGTVLRMLMPTCLVEERRRSSDMRVVTREQAHNTVLNIRNEKICLNEMQLCIQGDVRTLQSPRAARRARLKMTRAAAILPPNSSARADCGERI